MYVVLFLLEPVLKIKLYPVFKNKVGSESSFHKLVGSKSNLNIKKIK